MCQHDKFEIIYYNGWILVRKCVHCHEVEFQMGGGTESLSTLAHIIREVEGPEASAQWVSADGAVDPVVIEHSEMERLLAIDRKVRHDNQEKPSL